eukprot:m.247006 g.247006  ORF g.247006 m.247006 type:complete len:1001 (-) comp16124_c0_seq1:153-3155(-)
MVNCKVGSPCCPSPTGAAAETSSRYPPVTKKDLSTTPTSKGWKRARNAEDQFASYDEQVGKQPPSSPYTYAGDQLHACNFPLGGFGTGQVLFIGDGTLSGWTIQNLFHAAEYGPLHQIPNNFFAVSAEATGGKPQSFVLISPQNYTEANCNLTPGQEAYVSPAQVNRLQQLPGIKSLTIEGRYPIADVNYDIPGLPVTISMEAMTPLIPGDNKNSSLPVAVFSFKVTNSSSTTVKVNLMQAQQNFIGWDGSSDCNPPNKTPFWGGNVNTPFTTSDGVAGLRMTSNNVDPTAEPFGSLAACALPSTSAKVGVIASASDEADLFTKFSSGTIAPPTGAGTPPSASGTSYCGGVVQSVSVAAGSSETVVFVLSWNFPNRTRVAMVGHSHDGNKYLPDVLGNMYSNWFEDAVASAQYMNQNSQMLLNTTRMYRDTMFASTVPWEILDTAAGRVACMRSPTMWWAKNGIVLGNEGNVCCPLNCSHVYGYTVLLERLFPTLAMDMRVSDFVRNYAPGSGVRMRFGNNGFAIDGALAGVIKTYLAVRMSDPELKFLTTVWPNVKDQMELMLKNFDTDGDGVIRCAQQNTYDSAMYGANTFIGSYYVTALKVTAKMATLMGDSEFATTMENRATLSAQSYEKICWNEKFGYYIADVTSSNCKFSYGPGCFVDQLCAIGLSTACGQGYIFNPAHEAQARLSIAKYNVMTKPPFQDLQKHFFDGDTGVTVCTYPNGKLGEGMKYDTLVSTGFTYPGIAGMIYDRNLEQAVTLTGNIRKRQDGRNRSPWNEPECNILYSRAMAGYNLYDQACGLVYDCTENFISFDPRCNETNFQCFVSASGGWGSFSQKGDTGLANATVTLSAQFGTITVKTLGVVSSGTSAKASLDGSSIVATFSKGVTTLGTVTTIKAGSTLTITIGTGYRAPKKNSCCGGRPCGPSESKGLRQRSTAKINEAMAPQYAKEVQDIESVADVWIRPAWQASWTSFLLGCIFMLCLYFVFVHSGAIHFPK